MVVYIAIEIDWESGDYADPPKISGVSVFQTLDEALKITHHVIELELKNEVSFGAKLNPYKW